MSNSGLITLSSTPTRPIEAINDDYFYRSLCALVMTSVAAQETWRSALVNDNRQTWLKEYCTVRIGGPRQCGKTRAIFRYILEHNVSAYYFSNSRDTADRSFSTFSEMIYQRGLINDNTMQRRGLINLDSETFVNIDFANRTTFDTYRGASFAPFVFVDNCMWIEDATERLFSVMQFAEAILRIEDNFHFVMVG